MQCSSKQQEALVSLFFNISASSFLFLLLLYSSALLLLKFFHFVGGYPLLQRGEDEYADYAWFSEEEDEEEEVEEEEGEEERTQTDTYYHVTSRESNHLIADVLNGGECLVFYNSDDKRSKFNGEPIRVQRDEQEHEERASNGSSTEVQFSANDSPFAESDKLDDDDDDDDDEITLSRHDVVALSRNPSGPSRHELPQSVLLSNDDGRCNGNIRYNQNIENINVEADVSSKDDKFLVFEPSQLESQNLQGRKKYRDEDEDEREEIFGDSCTNGSTSKSSSEWRSSIKTEDPFSSSSRRSCPKWESYTVFQKYDEEMMFLSRISVEKLQETESLKSFKVQPRSISERIVHKFSNMNKRSSVPSSTTHRTSNPYQELESAYVAQICLTWEALSWNYTNFERKRSNSRRRGFDIGCPAGIADQFRRFQILLQRYIENEPYEHGRRPEIYARMRMLAPKLLLVPEYQDCEEEDKEEEEKDEGLKSRISSASFMMIMEECIRTFMNFLKADKEKTCERILKSFFGRKYRRCSVDPTLLLLMKKVNKKKKTKLKDLRRGGKYIRRKKLRVEEEMEILMGLIDLKVVSRVLRMSDISEERLHWCEEKMSKVRIIEGKLLRDSSPLFFAPH